MSYGHKVILNQIRTDTGTIDLDLSIDGLKIKPIKYSIDQECRGLAKITFTIYANPGSVILIREDPQNEETKEINRERYKKRSR